MCCGMLGPDTVRDVLSVAPLVECDELKSARFEYAQWLFSRLFHNCHFDVNR